MTRLAIVLAACGPAVLMAAGGPCAPVSIATAPDRGALYVACAERQTIEVLDAATGKTLRTVPLPARPAGLAFASRGASLWVAGGGANGRVLEIDPAGGTIRASLAAGHTPAIAVPSPDAKMLYVVNRFGGDVWFYDLAARRRVARVEVLREPQAAAVSQDGRWLLVANSLPHTRADTPPVAAHISVIDTASRQAVAAITLPNGSTGVRGLSLSPDGKLAAVTHILARYYLPTTQLDRGWMATNALSLIDVAGRRLAATVLLDNIGRGAANPWAVAWDAGGRQLLVSHAGAHAVSVIDYPALKAKLASEHRTLDPADDLTFLTGLRRRIALTGNGPRAMAVAGSRAYVAGYFSDTVEVLDLNSPGAPPVVLARFSGGAAAGIARRGEMLFNDGSICFQSWQSCATCHSYDGRVDGLNWDLINDGVGNPKNVRSLLLSHRTPPVMSHGVRERAEEAVRSGIRFILFARRPEAEAAAIDEYLKSLAPVPSPALVDGKLSPAAARGRKLFLSPATGCATCHPPGLFTDLNSYDVGTQAETDRSGEFDTPTLVELWRTAPYLHDGSAATLREVLVERNREDRHGRTSHLTPAEIEDLAAYLASL